MAIGRSASGGRALQARRSRLVALLVPNLANPAMAAIAESVETALQREGLVMVLCDTHDDPAIQDEYLLEMRAQLVCATVLLGAGQPAACRDGAGRAPLLFVNRRSPDGAAPPFIGIDNDRAGRAVADFFLSRRIAVRGVIHGHLASSATAEHVVAFRDALAWKGQPLADAEVVTQDVPDHMAIGYRCAGSLIAGRKPGALRNFLFQRPDRVWSAARHD